MAQSSGDDSSGVCKCCCRAWLPPPPHLSMVGVAEFANAVLPPCSELRQRGHGQLSPVALQMPRGPAACAPAFANAAASTMLRAQAWVGGHGQLSPAAVIAHAPPSTHAMLLDESGLQTTSKTSVLRRPRYTSCF